MSAQDQLEDRLRQASQVATGHDWVSTTLCSWLEYARLAAGEAGLECSDVQLSHVGQNLPGGAFTAAISNVRDPASGGRWQLQVVLFASNKLGEFGQTLGALELFHIETAPDGPALRYVSVLRHTLMSTTAFDAESVANVWPSHLATRLSGHVQAAADKVFPENGYQAEMMRFRVALEEALSP